MMEQPVAEDYVKRTERIKHLLSSYYGLDDSGQSTPASPDSARGDADTISARFAPVAGLDSPGFNADKHIQQVLKAYTLDKLIKEHHNMARDIKNLDTDMQQLVYENYNKFITATDTIRAMKANVDGMGMEMDKLKSIIDTVTENSNSVNSKLQQRRDHLDTLSKVQTITKKLQLLYDLPNRMQAALAEDALETAVEMYADAAPLLKKYGFSGALKAVAQHTDAVAKEVTQVLKKRLNERHHDTAHVVLLLRRMGEPDENLQDKYLHGRMQRMKRILKEADVVVDAMAAAYSGKTVTEAMLKKVEQPATWGFDEDLVAPALSSFIKALDERVINSMQETVLNLNTMFQNEKSPSTRRALVNMAKDVFNDYFKILKRALADASAAAIHKAARMKEASELTELTENSQSLVFMTDWGSDLLAQALQHMSADVCLLSSHLPELSLKDRCTEVAERAVRHHVSNGFSALEERVNAAVAIAKAKMQEENTVGTKNSSILVSTFSYASKALQSGLYALLMGLKAFEAHPRLLAGWHDIFVDLVQAHLQHMFLSLLAAFVEVTQVKYDGMDLLALALRNSSHLSEGFARTSNTLSLPRSASMDAQTGNSLTVPAAQPTAPEPPKSGMVLLLAKLCLYMEHIVPFTMEFLANNFGGKGGGRGGDQPPSFVAGEVARKLHTASSNLLQAYVELHGRQLSLMVRRSVAATNWLNHKEPRGPRPVCDLMRECLGKAHAEVLQLVESNTTSSSSSSTGPKPSAPQPLSRHSHRPSMGEGTLGAETGNVQRNVAKIFREKVQIFGDVQLTQPAIMAAIVGVGLKSLVECIRLQTLGRAGLQQLQLDMHYLRPHLLQYTTGSYSSTLESLMAEVISSSVERSTDPQLLDIPVLEKILAAANSAPSTPTSRPPLPPQ